MLQNYTKYGQTSSHDTVKFLALMAMIIDHIGMYFLPNMPELRVIGRIAMPLFLFLVGFTHNSEKKTKYNILFYGMLLYVFNYFLTVWNTGNPLEISAILPFNILITIFISRFALTYLEKIIKSPANLVGLMMLSLTFYLFTTPFFEYGTLAFLFAMAGKLIKTKQFSSSINHLFITTSLLAYLAIQSWVFELLPRDIMAFLIITLAVLVLMYTYEFRKIFITNIYVDSVIKFVSRYSLQIYVAHVIAFKLYRALFLVS